MPKTKVDYYLRDSESGKKINLERRDDKITILFKESYPTIKEEVLAKLRKMSANTEIVKISEKVYRLDYGESGSPNQVDDDIERIEKLIPEVIPYYVYGEEGDSLGEYYITNQLIITFKQGVPDVEIEKIIEKYKLNKIKAFNDEENIVIAELMPGNLINPIQMANDLEGELAVEIAEASMVNIFVTTSVATGATNANVQPADDLFSSQWYLDTQGNPEVRATAHVDALGAWTALGNGGSSQIVVCLIDLGFDINHPDLKNKISEPNLASFDFATPQTPFPAPLTFDLDHGTRCAGIAIAERNGNGVVGIAYGCTFLPVRCPQGPTDTDLLEIFRKVRHKADVISCSFAPDFRNRGMSRTLSPLIKKIGKSEGRRNKGCVICFPSGNFNLPINLAVEKYIFSLAGQEQDPYTGHFRNKYAIHPNVIAVAASSSKNKKAKYSCWGKEICVCAPSSDFEFDVSLPIGPGIVTTAFLGELRNGHYTDTFGGTSSATPLVAGIAALVLSANPDLEASEVKSILEQTADKINFNNATLAGTVGEYDAAGHSEWFGFGKVNAAAAVQEALTRVV